MKKQIYVVVAMMLCAVILFSACDLIGNVGNPNSTGGVTYTVTFLNYDNSLLYHATGIKESEPAIYAGQTPTRPDTSEYTYSFIGWDKDISAIYSNLSVFAKYSETRKTGNNDSNSGNEGNNPTFNTANTNGKLVAYQGEQGDSQTCVNSINIDNEYYFYYFYLGTISKVPVYTSVTLQYLFDTEVNFSFNNLNSDSLSNSISKSNAAVNSHSYGGNFQIGFKEELSSQVNAVFSEFKVSVSATQEVGQQWKNDWGTTLTDSQTSTSTYLTQYSEGYSEKVTFSEEARFTWGNYYRMSFYDTVNAYGVLVYEVATNTYSTTTDFLLKSNTTVRMWEESSTGVFEYQQEKSVEFDVNKAIEYAESHKLPEVTPPEVTPPPVDNGDTTNFAGGRGTAASPYLISNVTHFSNIRKYPSAVYSIIADIDAHGYRRFQPIDNFTGELRGENHAIYNFSIEESGTAQTVNIGLFRTNSGTIKNLIVGKQDNKSYDGQYSVKYDVNYIESNSTTAILLVGGLVGENSGTITDCKVDNVIINATLADNNNDKSLYIMVGGITGVNKGTISVSYVRYCNIDVKATAQIDSEDDASGWLGGICGKNESTVTQCGLQFSTLGLEVSADGTKSQSVYAGGFLGGIVGEQTSGTTSGCGIYQNTLHNIAGYGDWAYWDFHRQDVIGKITGGAYY